MNEIKSIIEEIDRLEAKATKGPWLFTDHGPPNYSSDDQYTVTEPGHNFDNLEPILMGNARHYNSALCSDDAEFITALRNAWPRIREELLK